MNAAIIEQIEPDPIEIDPRPCVLCGRTIDLHEMVDEGDGPIFFCFELSPEMTLAELECRAELRRQEEVAAIFARLEAMDDPSKRPPLRTEPDPYRPAASTVSAFWHLVGVRDPERLREWLGNHPQDAPTLIQLLEEG
jgi:hypothetical protein